VLFPYVSVPVPCFRKDGMDLPPLPPLPFPSSVCSPLLLPRLLPPVFQPTSSHPTLTCDEVIQALALHLQYIQKECGCDKNTAFAAVVAMSGDVQNAISFLVCGEGVNGEVFHGAADDLCQFDIATPLSHPSFLTFCPPSPPPRSIGSHHLCTRPAHQTAHFLLGLCCQVR